MDVEVAIQLILLLKNEIEGLKEKLKVDPENSSIPPSRSFKKKKNGKKKSSKKVGAQKGHIGKYRKLLPAEKVDNILQISAPTTCVKCRKIYSGNLPQSVDKNIFGPSLSATITSLVINYRLSKNKVTEILRELFGFKLCVGSVSNIEKRVSNALEKSYNNCALKLQKEEVVNADETRHLEKGKTKWCWLGASEKVTVYLFANSRGKKVAEQLLGERFAGVLISDRYAAYNFKELLFYQERLFYFWNLYKAAKISFIKLSKAVCQIKKQVEKVIYSGAHISHQRTANTCKNFFKVFDGFWTFTEQEGVDPTNNHAEQQIRSYVIYRKLSFGTKSENGTMFLQRAFTLAASCKKQAKDFVTYIADNIKAFSANIDPPLLFNDI